MPDQGKTKRALRRRQRIGPFLCWAVIFADIGTSVYYTPGILYGHVGTRAALFVAMTLVVFVLLAIKYAEVAVRYPEGGGVVTVGTRAFHPFVGLLGGMFILVDYFLTAALSALSGVIYLSVVFKSLGAVVVLGTVGALAILALLNLIGVKASAEASAIFAAIAGVLQLAVVGAVAVRLGPAHMFDSVHQVRAGPRLTPIFVLTGYAGAFLAFSGLESIAQLSPSMAEPRRRVANLSMGLVVITIALTSPLLTLWSTTLLGSHANPGQFISLLGDYAAGPLLASAVAISGALLLVFASNTALIGSYHVFLALTRTHFLPQLLAHRNRWRNTPHWAIAVAVLIPVAVVIFARGNAGTLGDLYAFGLLGAFVLTSLSLDVIRWHERTTAVVMVVGVITTAAVTIAWVTNLFAKPLATIFGGGLTVVGVAIGLATQRLAHRRGLPVVFPHLLRDDRPPILISRGRRIGPCYVLAVVPSDRGPAVALARAAVKAAKNQPIVFLYRGEGIPRAGLPHLMEIVDPYLNDPTAQDILGRVEREARTHGGHRKYIYVGKGTAAEAANRIAAALHPVHTLVVDSPNERTAPTAAGRPTRISQDSVAILDYGMLG
ncbi:MAG TPA: APC family permease [Candidatus Dormibacteraeota bacterium]|nr:APC family permease [Candidatus Dormibacteraeota bacterium]